MLAVSYWSWYKTRRRATLLSRSTSQFPLQQIWRFDFDITNCPFPSSDIPSFPAYGVLSRSSYVMSGPELTFSRMFNYPRATRCGGDIVTLPWFRPSVSASRLIHVNAIATKLLCKSSSNLADMFSMTRGWTLLILEVKGHCERDSD